MKEFEKHWNKEIKPYIHNPSDRELAKYWWKAALTCVLNNIDVRCTRTIDVQRFIEQELKIWEEEK